ncbi:hypothetical protein [Rhizobium sp. PL01]|uniref:O-antigen ligase family protein n=1 Tax=Rhizobium sp. PL01 TaxID=3085631 RepID=UPI0029828FCA|nr:hypothetical protein [Rhizobium sp. PL01]MDW5317025.1 hypothetical protein [Rhizobium sp. PL01]
MPSYQRGAPEFANVTRRADGSRGGEAARAVARNERHPPGRFGDVCPSVAVEPASKLPWPAVIFIIALVIPWAIYVGSLRLSPYRIVLIVMILPCFKRLISGQAGPLRLPDIAILLYCLWAVICLAVVHGLTTAIQSGGILFVETAGAYMLARAYIRTADDFYNMVSLLFKVVVFLLPFGIIEMVSGQKLLLQLFGALLPAIDATQMDPRWGLARVQGPFEHPILFGVCCGSILAMTYMVLGYGQSLARKSLKTAIVAGTAFLALSSGPLTALLAQVLLLSWNGVLSSMKARWKLLWLGIVAINVAVYLYSGESVARFYVSHAPLFDSWSAYYRLLIWEYGSATVMNHPIFGIGYNEYERPSWMVPSVDMFWLIHGIMFGLPGALFMALTFISTCALVGKKAILDPKISGFKTGYLIAMAGFFIVGWTVHFWNGTYSLFLFLLASGIWLADDASSPADGADGRRRNPISGDRGKETKATVARTKRLGIRV